MPRPFRNPNTPGEVEANYRYLQGLVILNPRQRIMEEPSWGLNAAYQLDHGAFFRGVPYDEVQWPEDGGVQFGRERPRQRDIDRNVAMLRLNHLKLEKVQEGPVIPLDVKLPPFRVDYDSHEQLNQKLNGTVILIKNQPFTVLQTAEQGGKYFLYVRGRDAIEGVVPYDEIKDTRGVAPGYWMYRGQVYWIYRVPERQNSQGMHQRNMHSKKVGERLVSGAQTNFMLEAFSYAKDMKYAPNLVDVVTATGGGGLRLSNRVALYLSGKRGAPLGVEYCGRPMGLIVNDYCKVSDELDLGPSWIRKDFSHVGLELRD